MKSAPSTFDVLLIQAIDESLSIMGEEPKKALYQYLLSIHLLKREDIPSKVGQFTAGMRRALGAASKVVERLILKRLYEKIGSTHQESQGFEFGDYIEDARQRFLVSRQDTLDDEHTSRYGSSEKSQTSS